MWSTICTLTAIPALIMTAALKKACIRETRHEIDAEVSVNITAHELVVVNSCPLHGGERAGSFPSHIKAAVQYGKNLQAMVVAFNTVGAVSINRTHEILGSVFNIPLSTGTIKNMVTRCADSLTPAYEKIRQSMVNLGLLHWSSSTDPFSPPSSSRNNLYNVEKCR